MPKPKPVRRVIKASKREPFPWLLLLILLGTIYVFWILPRQIGTRPVQVQFGTPEE